MANKRKPKTRLERVDAKVWSDIKVMMPHASSPEISRILYDTSLLKFEKNIRNFSKSWSVDLSVQKKRKK